MVKITTNFSFMKLLKLAKKSSNNEPRKVMTSMQSARDYRDKVNLDYSNASAIVRDNLNKAKENIDETLASL